MNPHIFISDIKNKSYDNKKGYDPNLCESTERVIR